MTNKSALVKLSSEDVRDDDGTLLGIIQRWGHHTGRGNSMYLYEPMNGREPGIATSRIQALSIIHTAPPEAVAAVEREVVVETRSNAHGIVEKVRDRSTRRVKYRWLTADKRLGGPADSWGAAETALQEACGG